MILGAILLTVGTKIKKNKKNCKLGAASAATLVGIFYEEFSIQEVYNFFSYLKF